MRAFFAIVVAVGLFATTYSQEIRLSMRGPLMESGLRLSPDGEVRYRTSDYMQQLWMASTAQTLAARGKAGGCRSLERTEDRARSQCPLGHDDYIFEFTFDASRDASVLRVYAANSQAPVDPIELESLLWELPGAGDQELLNRAELDHITVTVAMEAVLDDGSSGSRQASGTTFSVDDAIMYAAKTVGSLAQASGRDRTWVKAFEVELSYRVELRDGEVFEHDYFLPRANFETFFTEPWMSHVTEARWTLTSQYEASNLEAIQMFRRNYQPDAPGSNGR